MQDSTEKDQLIHALMNRLGSKDRERVKALLSDKKACEKILNSPEAQDLIRQLKGGK